MAFKGAVNVERSRRPSDEMRYSKPWKAAEAASGHLKTAPTGAKAPCVKLRRGSVFWWWNDVTPGTMGSSAPQKWLMDSVEQYTLLVIIVQCTLYGCIVFNNKKTNKQINKKTIEIAMSSFRQVS